MAFEEDPSIFFDDFGDLVIYSSSSGINKQIRAIIDLDVDLVSDDVVMTSNTATFEVMTVAVGDSIKQTLRSGIKTWKVGRTLSNDGTVMTVIIS